jgi:hypothetical protein
VGETFKIGALGQVVLFDCKSFVFTLISVDYPHAGEVLEPFKRPSLIV